MTFACPNCGLAFEKGSPLCPNCGARLNRRSVMALWGLVLILGGAAAAVAGLLLGAVGAISGALSCVEGCFSINTPNAAVASRHVESARAQVEASGILVLGGFEVGLLGVLFCAMRPWRPTGPNTLRNTALASLGFAVVGLGLWLAFALGAPLGAPSWPDPAVPPARILFLVLAAAAVAASLVQLAASTGVLRKHSSGEEWLYRATLGKFGAYTTIWLSLPLLASKLGGGAAYDGGYWLFTTGVVILYHWMVVRLGYLRHRPTPPEFIVGEQGAKA